ncbi:alkaline phosphatase family protein [Candidatus Woesearchaeota archaeon]|nr:alkaline phosphatase family protein [Candidatus Woesearchaeota archaeon]
MSNSVLIIGIDGASWDLLEPWMKNGDLPALSRLVKSGTSAYLKTTVPPLSISAWVSLFTGRNPGKHGVYEFMNDNGRLANSRTIKSEKVWQVLSRYGKRCCIINVPGTYPVDKLNGYMVSCFLTPPDEKVYSYPTDIMSLLKSYDYKTSLKYGDFTIVQDNKHSIENRQHYLDGLYYINNRRFLTLKELMKEKWDFFMLVFDETSPLQALFFDNKEVIREFLKKLDSYIGHLIKTFVERNENPYIFIVSDHGFSLAPKKSFNFRVWLSKEGFLKDKRTFMQKIIPKIYAKLSKTGLLKLMFLFRKSKEIRESFHRKSAKSASVFYRYPGVFINSRDMNSNEYEKLRNEIISKLKKVRDPSNNDEIFQVIEKREKLYHGNSLNIAPDIVVIPTNKYANIFSYDSDKLFDKIETYLPGKHFSDLTGIFAASGAGIKQSTISNVSIMDVVPTSLHILDIPIPKDMDGKVLKEIFKDDSMLFSKEIFYSEEDKVTLDEKAAIRDVIQKIKI